MLKSIKDGGIFCLNVDVPKDKIESFLPNKLKKQIAEKHVQFYCFNAGEIAQSVGLGNRISMVTVMFLMNFGMSGLFDIKKAAESMKTLCKITYAKQP